MPSLTRTDRRGALLRLPLPVWLPPDLWPFDTFELWVDGARIAVSATGRGPVLLFYTGIGSFIWRDVMLALSSTFHCVTLDPPGIGLSAPVPSDPISLERSARAVDAVIQALELGGVTLVVHDTGGPPAFAAAARHGNFVNGLVGVNTFGWRPSGAAFRGLLALMGSRAMRLIDLTTGVLPRITSTAFGVGRHLDARSREAYRVGIARGVGAFHDYLRDARDSTIYEELDRAFAGPLGQLPLLTIFGERNDPLGFQPRWKTLFPSAQQIVIPKGNHFPMCDDPRGVAKAIGEWHREHVAIRKEQGS
ncbi:MAG TPA: alpha/beta fold hydrolase [Vicinamibacterales bacterium]